MQKANFHTPFTHTHCLLSRGLPKHCKGTARPYTKITLPIPKMELLLGRDLLTCASNTHDSLDERGKRHMKRYFPGKVPLFMQDMVVGSLSIKRKHSREDKNPILLRCGTHQQHHLLNLMVVSEIGQAFPSLLSLCFFFFSISIPFSQDLQLLSSQFSSLSSGSTLCTHLLEYTNNLISCFSSHHINQILSRPVLCHITALLQWAASQRVKS